MSRSAARAAERWGLDLPDDRVRDRLSAYVYGNILVLSAVAVLEPTTVGDGYSVVAVLATTLTTYVAHVVAHVVGAGFQRSAPVGGVAHEAARRRAGHEVAHELRDAVPIISSGAAPVAVLLLGLADVLGSDATVLLAAGVVVARLAGMGVLVGRLSGRPPSGRQWLAGLALAAVSAVVVVAKVVLLH